MILKPIRLLLLFTMFFMVSRVMAEEGVTINLVNADVEAVVKLAAELTGRNFVLDPRVKGQVNVVSGQPVPRALVYPLLTSALRMHGFAVVESNGITKIVPETDARMHAPPAQSTGKGGDRLVTRIFQLKNGSASQLVPVLKPLVGANNVINAFASANALVVTDYAENINRLSALIENLEGSDPTSVAVIPVRHASAVDLAQHVARLMEGNAPKAVNDGGPTFSVLADYRSNSLLLRADSPLMLQKLRTLIDDLDQPTASAGNIHVVPLKNAEAAALAKTLREVFTGSSPQTPVRTVAAPPPPGASAPLAGLLTGQVAPQTPGSTGSGIPGFIQADPATNTLIITAPDAIYRNLRQVIEQLDRRRAQVFIEALVVEITSDRAAEFGIQWQAGGSDGKSGILGGTNLSTGTRSIIGLAESIAQAKSTGTVNLPPGLNIGFFHEGLGLAGLVRLLASDNRANILSVPNLLTLDNEEARIVIGQNVPFLTGQYAQTGSSVTPTPFQTIERKDVGITLKVKPQISEGGTVRLQLQQEASSVQDNTQAGPITSKRSIESTVLVDDGMVVVLGGLMEDSVVKGEDKVPGLGDVPVIGGMFRYETSKRGKKNLMVFLRPSIIRDAAGGQRLSSDRYANLLGRQQRFNAEERVEAGPEIDRALPAFPAIEGTR